VLSVPSFLLPYHSSKLKNVYEAFRGSTLTFRSTVNSWSTVWQIETRWSNRPWKKVNLWVWEIFLASLIPRWICYQFSVDIFRPTANLLICWQSFLASPFGSGHGPVLTQQRLNSRICNSISHIFLPQLLYYAGCHIWQAINLEKVFLSFGLIHSFVQCWSLLTDGWPSHGASLRHSSPGLQLYFCNPMACMCWRISLNYRCGTVPPGIPLEDCSVLLFVGITS
jgi:hypothetical protein